MKHVLVLSTILALELYKPCLGLSEKQQKLVSASNGFALRLLKTLPSSENENVLFSPYSFTAALGMIYAGSSGTTQQELSEALGYTQPGLNETDIQEAFALQNRRLHSESAPHGFQLANAAAAPEGLEILDTYYDALNHSFNAPVLKVDFAHNGQQAVHTINGWVKQATHDKVEKLFDEPLHTDSKIVILNAAVFKGLWARQFRREQNKRAPFLNGGTERQDADYMYQQVKVNNVVDRRLHTQAVELLYHGGDYSMIILLPFDSIGVEALKQQLTIENLDAILSSMRNTTVALFLPKFELDKLINLKRELESLGLQKLLDKPDLSGVTGNPDLMVSDVVQRALVKVDEEGREAADPISFLSLSVDSFPLSAVVVDHPFLFFIRNRITREIFFAGQVNKL